jgi:pimeloyl-ACP methyl ester carboxylesterase
VQLAAPVEHRCALTVHKPSVPIVLLPSPLAVLVHGFGAFGGQWRFNLAPLAEAGYTVYAPTLPGFGRSEKAALQYWLPDVHTCACFYCAHVPERACQYVKHTPCRLRADRTVNSCPRAEHVQT